MMKTYSQLTYEQRCNISILNKIGYSQHMIADEAGISQLTISSWFKRNTGQRSYRENKLKGLATIPSKKYYQLKDGRKMESRTNIFMAEY